MPTSSCSTASCRAPERRASRGSRPRSDLAMRCGARASWSAANGSDRKSTRLNSSHTVISYAVFCLKKKKKSKHKHKTQSHKHSQEDHHNATQERTKATECP